MLYNCLKCKKNAVKPEMIEGKWQGKCDKCGFFTEIGTYIKLDEENKARDIREISSDGSFDKRNLESK